MTLHNSLFSLLVLLICTSGWGQNLDLILDQKILLRDEKNNLVETPLRSPKIHLKDFGFKDDFLNDPQSFDFSRDGDLFAHFKFVEGVAPEPKPWLESKRDWMRILNLAYHLNKARLYFLSNFDVAHLKTGVPLVVRYNMDRKYIAYMHYSDNPKIRIINTSETVPGSGAGKVKPGVEGWGPEMWFRPMVEEELKAPQRPVPPGTEAAIRTLDMSVQQAVLFTALNSARGFDIDFNQILESSGHFQILAAAQFLMPKVFSIFSQNQTYKMRLDTAMIPDIIYHEYAHVATGDFLIPSWRDPITENLAHYFAAVISGNTGALEIASAYGSKTEAFSVNPKARYTEELSRSVDFFGNAHTTLVYSFLWRIRSRMEMGFPPHLTDGNLARKLFDKIVFEARKPITTFADSDPTSDILRSVFISGLRASARDVIWAQSELSPGQKKAIARELNYLILQKAQEMGF